MASETTSEQLPEDIRRFLLTSVPSVPYLEAILVFRAAGARPVSVRELASRLYIPEKSAFDIVVGLREAGIVATEPGTETHHYNAQGELAATLEALAGIYARDLIGVTRIIHSRTGRMAQQFADAFKFRKDS
jgi:hypothetical protein